MQNISSNSSNCNNSKYQGCDSNSKDNVKIDPRMFGAETNGELFEVSNHIYEDIEVYKNVTVVVSKCIKCGEVSLCWFKQEDTEEIPLDEWEGKPT